MPHLRLEYTSNIPRRVDSRELFSRLHRILVEVAEVEIGNCKSRAIELGDFVMADDAGDEGFVHLDLRILSGKTPATKTELGRRLLEELRQAYASGELAMQLSIEIRDIDRDAYFKHM
jgi:5-carboxymethyl-2-hydroxymuconate isomerase